MLKVTNSNCLTSSSIQYISDPLIKVLELICSNQGPLWDLVHMLVKCHLICGSPRHPRFSPLFFLDSLFVEKSHVVCPVDLPQPVSGVVFLWWWLTSSSVPVLPANGWLGLETGSDSGVRCAHTRILVCVLGRDGRAFSWLLCVLSSAGG